MDLAAAIDSLEGLAGNSMAFEAAFIAASLDSGPAGCLEPGTRSALFLSLVGMKLGWTSSKGQKPLSPGDLSDLSLGVVYGYSMTADMVAASTPILAADDRFTVASVLDYLAGPVDDDEAASPGGLFFAELDAAVRQLVESRNSIQVQRAMSEAAPEVVAVLEATTTFGISELQSEVALVIGAALGVLAAAETDIDDPTVLGVLLGALLFSGSIGIEESVGDSADEYFDLASIVLGVDNDGDGVHQPWDPDDSDPDVRRRTKNDLRALSVVLTGLTGTDYNNGVSFNRFLMDMFNHAGVALHWGTVRASGARGR